MIACVSKKISFIQFLFLFFFCCFGLAQVQEDWVSRYNGSGNAPDAAVSVKVDTFENVYVSGYSTSIGSGKDFVIVKYDSTGVEQWVRVYNGPGNDLDSTTAMAMDSSGNVCICGVSEDANLDFATVKYDAAGDTQWVRRYNGSGNGYDGANAIAADRFDNVYVTGSSYEGPTAGIIYTTIKYRPNGDTAWVRHYNPQDEFVDRPTAITLDHDCNVYITGWSAEGLTGGTYFATVKYDSAGVQQWEDQYGQGYDEATAIAVDGTGNVYVTGYSYDYSGGGDLLDYMTIKYDPGGVRQWVRRYKGPGHNHDGATAIAIDDSAYIYVTGWSLGSGTNFDFATIKYSPDSVEVWVRRYNGPGYGPDWGTALAIDQANNIYVTGLSVESGGTQDYMTIKYTSHGDTVWQIHYDGTAQGQDIAYSIALDQSQNVYITGASPGIGSESDYATIKYIQQPGMIEESNEGEMAGSVIRFYPVPARTVVNLNIVSSLCSGNDRITVAIYDICGKKVKEEELSVNNGMLQVPLSDVNAGVYFLKLNTGERKLIGKLVITR